MSWEDFSLTIVLALLSTINFENRLSILGIQMLDYKPNGTEVVKSSLGRMDFGW